MGDEASDWHETWQAFAANRGHQIEVVVGRHRADIVTRSGLVVELHSGTRTGQAPEVTEVREAVYGAAFAQGMIWVVRRSTHELRPSGWFDGPVHESLGHMNARAYLAGDITEPVHAVSITRRWSEAWKTYHGSMRSAGSWGHAGHFLAWAESWRGDHLPPGGWRQGVWHADQHETGPIDLVHPGAPADVVEP